MREAVRILHRALWHADPAEAYAVAHKAVASAMTVVLRADDSSGIIGDACRDLLELHPKFAARAQVPPAKLIAWMMKFQFDSEVDFFELDPAAYAPVLGEKGLAAYRAKLDDVRRQLSPKPEVPLADDPDYGARFTLEWNDQRLAVFDRDIDEIIRTHARDRKAAQWFHDTAKALEEIGEYDLAIEWAKQAVDFDDGFQSFEAAEYWCTLVKLHRHPEYAAAREHVFWRWPLAQTATALRKVRKAQWAAYDEKVMAALSAKPAEAVAFAIMPLNDPQRAWQLAHDLKLDDPLVWNDLARAYVSVDKLATLPVHERLVRLDLQSTGAEFYGAAAHRLERMRLIASGTSEAARVDALILELREEHRGRPRLQKEFDRFRLPRAR